MNMHILSDQQFQQITTALEQAFVAINAAQHVDLDLTVKPTITKAPAVKAESQPKTRRSRRKTRGALTEKNVLEIKRLLSNGSRSMAQIARDFGVHYTTVTHIKAGKTWKHVVLQQDKPATVVI